MTGRASGFLRSVRQNASTVSDGQGPQKERERERERENEREGERGIEHSKEHTGKVLPLFQMTSVTPPKYFFCTI